MSVFTGGSRTYPQITTEQYDKHVNTVLLITLVELICKHSINNYLKVSSRKHLCSAIFKFIVRDISF